MKYTFLGCIYAKVAARALSDIDTSFFHLLQYTEKRKENFNQYFEGLD
jgi:hypothetical protein